MPGTCHTLNTILICLSQYKKPKKTKIAFTNPILHPTTGMTFIEGNTQNTKKSIDTAYVT